MIIVTLLFIIFISEPFVLNNSTFGPGQYPIVYSNFACGGYENSLSDCKKQIYPNTDCSQSNVAGVLCGYGKFEYNTHSAYHSLIHRLY